MEKRNAIELFSGSKTVSGMLEKNGFNVISIDNDPKLSPSMCCDILELTREDLPPDIAFSWASVPCTTFSRQAPVRHWQKETFKYRMYNYSPLTFEARSSVALLSKTIEILSWYPGAAWVIENPVGRITHMPALKELGHYRYFVNYADFGFSYSKETYLFSNFLLPFDTKKHKVDAPGMCTVHSAFERSKVPGTLVQKIINYL